MKSENVNKEQWVSMFQEIGLDKETMGKWHRVFERNNPEGHKEFLAWLNIPSEEIDKIRSL